MSPPPASATPCPDPAKPQPLATALLALLGLALLGLAGLALMAHHLIELAQGLRGGVATGSLTGDFRIYLCGATDLASPYDRCLTAEAVSGFVYPPPSLVYFHLLARLPLTVAFVVHTLVSLGSLALATRLLLRHLPAPPAVRAAATCAALGIAPVGTSLAAGQVNVILMVTCVAAACYAAEAKPLRAGLAAALGFWLKLYPGLVPVLFLTRRKWPSAAATVAATGLIGLVALSWAPPGLYRTYFGVLLPHVSHYTQPGVAHSIAGIALHASLGGGPPSFHFVAIPPTLQWLSRLALLGALGLALAHQRLTRDRDPTGSLGVLLCGLLIATPNAWGYHYALIYPALLVALVRTLERFGWRTPLALLGWAALVVPDWTRPPAAVAAEPLLNVAFHGRYAAVALLLIVLAFTQARRAPESLALGRIPH